MSLFEDAKKDADEVLKGSGTVYHVERLARHVLELLHIVKPEAVAAPATTVAPAAPAGVVEGAEVKPSDAAPEQKLTPP